MKNVIERAAENKTDEKIRDADGRGKFPNLTMEESVAAPAAEVTAEQKATPPMLSIRPITLREANRYVAREHRHNKPTNGHKFSVACYDGDRLCGVAIAGQPIARKLDDGLTIEIRRVCTDGTRNACSILYGACSRIAKDMGYKRVVTYTLISESGASLRASGFINCGEAGGVSWNMPSRPREVDQITLFGTERKYPDEKKIRWERRYK